MWIENNNRAGGQARGKVCSMGQLINTVYCVAVKRVVNTGAADEDHGAGGVGGDRGCINLWGT